MKGSVISIRVSLVGWILGRMEKKEWRIGEKMSGKVFGWKGRGREKWWGQQVFSPPPPSKYNLSKLERKLEWKVGKIFEQNCPTFFYVSGSLFFLPFFSFDFSILTLAFRFFFFLFSFFGLVRWWVLLLFLLFSFFS